MIKPGNLLVSSREGSRENLEIIAKHPEIKARLMTWTTAVFLMLEAQPGRGLVAVSASKPVQGPPPDVKLGSRARQAWSQLTKEGRLPHAGFCLKHFDGGPMNRDEPICVVGAPGAAGWDRAGDVKVHTQRVHWSCWL